MSLMEIHEDIQGYDVLEMNSHGMFSCQNASLDEAESVLTTAYAKLQSEETAAEDPIFADRLKAITLNNLGVVHCHKGQPRKALEHLEAAFAVESRLGVVSPSTTLNLCAAHNAMRHYDKATQYALQTIDALHHLPDEELKDHKVLWGAAWHNLGVAQINTAALNSRHVTITDNSTVFSIFRNAMQATQELLGPKHPMTVAVHQTFRELRESLKKSGVFDQHRTFPPLNDREKQLTVNLVGSDHFRYQQATSKVPFVKPHRPGDDRGANRHMTASQRYAYRLRQSLRNNSGVYTDLHPLLRDKQPRRSLSSRGGARALHSSEGARVPPAPPGKARKQVAGSALPALPSPPGTAQGVRRPTPREHASRPSPRGVGSQATAAGSPPRRRLSELLMGDMWVEVNGNTTQSLLNSLPRTARTASQGADVYYPPVRPNYAEAMHVIQPEEFDDTMDRGERVVDPQSNAILDHQVHQQPTSSAAGKEGSAGATTNNNKNVGLTSTQERTEALGGFEAVPRPENTQSPGADSGYEGLGALAIAMQNTSATHEEEFPNVRQLTDTLEAQGKLKTPTASSSNMKEERAAALQV